MMEKEKVTMIVIFATPSENKIQILIKLFI